MALKSKKSSHKTCVSLTSRQHNPPLPGRPGRVPTPMNGVDGSGSESEDSSGNAGDRSQNQAPPPVPTMNFNHHRHNPPPPPPPPYFQPPPALANLQYQAALMQRMINFMPRMAAPQVSLTGGLPPHMNLLIPQNPLVLGTQMFANPHFAMAAQAGVQASIAALQGNFLELSACVAGF